MRLPRWFIYELLFWLVFSLPMYVMTAGFAGRWLFLPDPPGHNLNWSVWLGAVVTFYHPILTLPFAVWQARQKVKNAQD